MVSGLQIRTNNEGVEVDAVRIAKNGYVGIGTTNPLGRLQVHAAASFFTSGGNLNTLIESGDWTLGSFIRGDDSTYGALVKIANKGNRGALNSKQHPLSKIF